MSAPSRPPVLLLTVLSDFLDSQDGSKNFTELQSAIVDHVNVRISTQQTLDSLAGVARRTQDHVRRVRLTQQATTDAVAAYEALQVVKGSVRRSAAKLAAFDRKNANIIEAYTNRKIIKDDKWIKAEKRFIDELAELKKKNISFTAEKKKEALQVKEAAKQQKEVEKKAREQKAADEKAQKKAAEEKKLELENELKLKKREAQAAESLALRAKAVNSETERKEVAARQKEIDEQMLIGIKLWNAQQLALQSRKRKERAEEVKSDSDKENDGPADE